MLFLKPFYIASLSRPLYKESKDSYSGGAKIHCLRGMKFVPDQAHNRFVEYGEPIVLNCQTSEDISFS